jgi:hypothetical protein
MRLLVFVVLIPTMLFSNEWNNVKYFYKKIPGTNKEYVEKTYKGITYNTYVVEKDVRDRRACTINKLAKQHAIFLGCSLVFGDGVENKDTLPQLFQNSSAKHQVYNYGYCGDGPNNTLYRFTHTKICDEIEQKKGICFFIYPIGWHEMRIRLHSDYLYNKKAPYYEVKSGKLLYRGSLKNTQWLLYNITQIYNLLPIPEKYRQPFPKYPTEKDYILIADILCGIRDEYKKQFNSDNFYVVIHPFSNSVPVNEVIRILQDKKLKIINFDNLNSCQKFLDKYTIASWDGHPNARMNKLIVSALAVKMRELGY